MFEYYNTFFLKASLIRALNRFYRSRIKLNIRKISTRYRGTCLRCDFDEFDKAFSYFVHVAILILSEHYYYVARI